MSTAIKVQRIDATKINNIDFSNLTFGANFSDHVFIADYKNGEWKNFRIEPFSFCNGSSLRTGYFRGYESNQSA
jgi:hypothetical protein